MEAKSSAHRGVVVLYPGCTVVEVIEVAARLREPGVGVDDAGFEYVPELFGGSA